MYVYYITSTTIFILTQSVNPLAAAVPQTGMAAYSSLLPSSFSTATSPKTFFRASIKTHNHSKSLLLLHRNPNSFTISYRLRVLNSTPPTTTTTSNNDTSSLSIHSKPSIFSLNSLSTNHPFSSTLVESLFILSTSIALSFSLFISDVDSASAFVVTPSRKLQADELSTVRLFQNNTPSVVYITNIAVRYIFQFCISFDKFRKLNCFVWLTGFFFFRQDAFTLDVLEVPQGSGSGFVWDKDGHIVTNYHVIRGASDLRLVFLSASSVIGVEI